MLSELVAAYGAILATALGIIQFTQWRQSRRFIALSYKECSHSEFSQIELIIANRGSHDVSLDYVACGAAGRYWKNIWRKDSLALLSMLKIAEYSEEGAIKNGTADVDVLAPGGLIRVCAKKEVFSRQIEQSRKLPMVFVRPCVWIEHSQSDKPICKTIEWT